MTSTVIWASLPWQLMNILNLLQLTCNLNLYLQNQEHHQKSHLAQLSLTATQVPQLFGIIELVSPQFFTNVHVMMWTSILFSKNKANKYVSPHHHRYILCMKGITNALPTKHPKRSRQRITVVLITSVLLDKGRSSEANYICPSHNTIFSFISDLVAKDQSAMLHSILALVCLLYGLFCCFRLWDAAKRCRISMVIENKGITILPTKLVKYLVLQNCIESTKNIIGKWQIINTGV